MSEYALIQTYWDIKENKAKEIIIGLAYLENGVFYCSLRAIPTDGRFIMRPVGSTAIAKAK